MDDGVLAVILLALGLAFLIAEIFVPSGGMLLVLTAITLAFALICAYSAWWETHRVFWWSYVAILVFLIPGAIGGAFAILPRTSFGKMILAVPPTEDEVTPFSKEDERLQLLLGKFGKTVSLLTPGGIVMIDEERMHAESEGMVIEPGEPVKIIGTKGNRLVVRKLSEQEKRQAPDESIVADVEDPPSAFDLSEGE